MFKTILKKYLKKNNINQQELSLLVGDKQQAVSHFLKSKSNPNVGSKDKYFSNLEGFKSFYEKELKNIDPDSITNKFSINQKWDELMKDERWCLKFEAEAAKWAYLKAIEHKESQK